MAYSGAVDHRGMAGMDGIDGMETECRGTDGSRAAESEAARFSRCETRLDGPGSPSDSGVAPASGELAATEERDDRLDPVVADPDEVIVQERGCVAVAQDPLDAVADLDPLRLSFQRHVAVLR